MGYNSLINELRKSIHKHALESKLLGLIGQAEMEKGIQEIVKRINQDKDSLEKDTKQPLLNVTVIYESPETVILGASEFNTNPLWQAMDIAKERGYTLD
jgi:hypothetical protein